jgi:hypothetical protein
MLRYVKREYGLGESEKEKRGYGKNNAQQDGILEITKMSERGQEAQKVWSVNAGLEIDD